MAYNNDHAWGRSYASLQSWVAPTVTTKELLGYDVVAFGVGNTYYQQCLSLMYSSGVTASCVNTKKEFLCGDGFVNELWGKSIVNFDKQTANELLELVSSERATFNGCAVLVNYNLLGESVSAEIIPFENVRLCVPDQNRCYTKVAVWDDWAFDSQRTAPSRADIRYYNLYNPSTVLEEIEKAGGINKYCGQVKLFTNTKMTYPLVSFHPVLNQVQTSGALAEFEANYVMNGLSVSGIIVNESESTNQEAYDKNLLQLEALGGSRTAGGIAYLEGKLKFEQVGSSQLDKDHTAVKKSVNDDIIQNFGIPPILIGRVRDGGFPNVDELENSFAYYNGVLRRERKEIESFFAELFANWFYEINPSGDYSIKPQTFQNESDVIEVPQAWAVLNSDEQRAYVAQKYEVPLIEAQRIKQNGKDATANESTNPEQATAQAQLRGSVGGVQGILQIADNYKRGIITDQSALTILEEIYGFSTQIAQEILGINGTAGAVN